MINFHDNLTIIFLPTSCCRKPGDGITDIRKLKGYDNRGMNNGTEMRYMRAGQVTISDDVVQHRHTQRHSGLSRASRGSSRVAPVDIS